MPGSLFSVSRLLSPMQLGRMRRSLAPGWHLFSPGEGTWLELVPWTLVFIPGAVAEPENREHHPGSLAAWWGPRLGLAIVVGGAQT